MSYVLRLVHAPDGSPLASVTGPVETILAAASRTMVRAEYVEAFDAEANNGRGNVWLTEDLTKAKRFESVEAAVSFWKTQSTVRPLRPDGKPNLPLTAFHMTVEEA